MNVERHAKRMYDKFGAAYQRTRDKRQPDRAFNELLELPTMLKAVGDIHGKFLLDIGCGAGVHIKRYLAKGARCTGLDISDTMLGLARRNCPKAEFKQGTFTRLPFKDRTFDIVTASLSLDYCNDLSKTMQEVCRVLRKGGMFYYSDESPVYAAIERYEDKNIKCRAAGSILDKRTGRTIYLGHGWREDIVTWEMIPGMTMKTYTRTLGTRVRAFVENGFELVDVIDCKPTAAFKRRNRDKYEAFSRIPIFSVYVARKK